MASTPVPAAAARSHAQLFHALSDETRLAVLDLLRAGERCVCDLQDDLDAAQSRLSFHLRVLREAGLVRDRKEGRWSYYSLNPARAADIEAFARELAAPRRAGGPVLHQIAKRRIASGTPRSRGGSGTPEPGCCP